MIACFRPLWSIVCSQLVSASRSHCSTEFFDGPLTRDRVQRLMGQDGTMLQDDSFWTMVLALTSSVCPSRIRSTSHGQFGLFLVLNSNTRVQTLGLWS